MISDSLWNCIISRSGSMPSLPGDTLCEAVSASAWVEPHGRCTVAFALARSSPQIKFQKGCTYNRYTKFYETYERSAAVMVHDALMTNDPKDADIIWTSQQVDEDARKAIGLQGSQYINQFPFEACIVMKHHLAETIHMAQGLPEWFQPTYNLETHLSALIGNYFMRQRDGVDNLWIIKPWNMARTIDTTVTGDLPAIIRLMETGPKICQKYIEHPALFKGRKFDLRYIVLVRSMNPVEIFLSDVFWVRLANNMYTLQKNSLFEYETHFTVMNYIGKLNHMRTPDFVREFEEEHKVVWLDIHQRIQGMIQAVSDSAAIVRPDMHSPMSRAMYDLM